MQHLLGFYVLQGALLSPKSGGPGMSRVPRIPPSEITPEGVYLHRRDFLELAGLMALTGPLAACERVLPGEALQNRSTLEPCVFRDEGACTCCRNRAGLDGWYSLSSLYRRAFLKRPGRTGFGSQVCRRRSADGRQPLKPPGVFEGTRFGKPARYGWGRMV